MGLEAVQMAVTGRICGDLRLVEGLVSVRERVELSDAVGDSSEGNLRVCRGGVESGGELVANALNSTVVLFVHA